MSWYSDTGTKYLYWYQSFVPTHLDKLVVSLYLLDLIPAESHTNSSIVVMISAVPTQRYQQQQQLGTPIPTHLGTSQRQLHLSFLMLAALGAVSVFILLLAEPTIFFENHPNFPPNPLVNPKSKGKFRKNGRLRASNLSPQPTI